MTEAPKRPLSAYQIFASKVRADFTGSFSEIAVELGKHWTAMSPEDKEFFEAEARKQKDQYEIDLKNYMILNPSYIKDLKDETLIKKFNKEPEKLIFYIAHIRKLQEDKFEINDQNKANILKKMTAFWKSSDDQFKKQYIDLLPKGSAKLVVEQLFQEYSVLE